MSFATADLYDDHAQDLQVLEPRLRSFGKVPKFYGPISTVKCFEDNSRVKEAVGEPGEGKVLVVDGGGSLRCALLGDNLAGSAAKNGWAGIVVFGCIRDAAIIQTIDLGVLALATIPAKSNKRQEGQRDIDVRFLNATFRPGEYLYADEDGVVVSASSLP